MSETDDDAMVRADILFGSIKIVPVYRIDGDRLLAGGYSITYDQHGVEVSRTKPTFHCSITGMWQNSMYMIANYWVVPPSMTAEELAQKLAEAIRQAIREAGEAAHHDLKRHLRAVIVAFSEVEPNPEDFQNVSAASQFLASMDAEWASAIRQRLP